jgi:hypothetical protein
VQLYVGAASRPPPLKGEILHRRLVDGAVWSCACKGVLASDKIFHALFFCRPAMGRKRTRVWWPFGCPTSGWWGWTKRPRGHTAPRSSRIPPPPSLSALHVYYSISKGFREEKTAAWIKEALIAPLLMPFWGVQGHILLFKADPSRLCAPLKGFL